MKWCVCYQIESKLLQVCDLINISTALTDRYEALQARCSAIFHQQPSKESISIADLETWLYEAERLLEANLNKTPTSITDLETAIRSHQVRFITCRLAVMDHEFR